jgi:hypothetical protein
MAGLRQWVPLYIGIRARNLRLLPEFIGTGFGYISIFNQEIFTNIALITH